MKDLFDFDINCWTDNGVLTKIVNHVRIWAADAAVFGSAGIGATLAALTLTLHVPTTVHTGPSYLSQDMVMQTEARDDNPVQTRRLNELFSEIDRQTQLLGQGKTDVFSADMMALAAAALRNA